MTPLGVPVVPELKGRQQISDEEMCCGVIGAARARKWSSHVASGCKLAEAESEGDTMTWMPEHALAAADAQSINHFKFLVKTALLRRDTYKPLAASQTLSTETLRHSTAIKFQSTCTLHCDVKERLNDNLHLLLQLSCLKIGGDGRNNDAGECAAVEHEGVVDAVRGEHGARVRGGEMVWMLHGASQIDLALVLMVAVCGHSICELLT